MRSEVLITSLGGARSLQQQAKKHALAVAIEERPIDCYIDKSDRNSNIMLTWHHRTVEAKSRNFGDAFQIFDLVRSCGYLSSKKDGQ